jgi:hypothetical protein
VNIRFSGKKFAGNILLLRHVAGGTKIVAP